MQQQTTVFGFMENPDHSLICPRFFSLAKTGTA
jgi:hypothetical protein